MADLSEFMKVPIGNYSEIMGVSRASFHSLLGGHGNVPTGGPGPGPDSTSTIFVLSIDDTNVNSDLTDFPVLVSIDSTSGITGVDLTSIFNLIDETSATNISFTDGTSNLYAEIESWDDINRKATIWVKVPSVLSSGGATIYMNYGGTTDNSTYIGYTGSSAAQNVWDSNFVGVWHMAQIPTGTASILDSTVNGYHLDSHSMDSGDLVDAEPGKGLYFDGATHWLSRTYLSEINANDHTVEAMVNDTTNMNRTIFHQGDYNQANQQGWRFGVSNTTGGLVLQYFNGGYLFEYSDTYVPYDQPVHVAYGYDVSEIDFYFWIDGNLDPTESNALGFVSTVYPVRIGCYKSVANANFWYGTISEVRISDIRRPDAWMKATRHSNMDNMITYSTTGTSQTAHGDLGIFAAGTYPTYWNGIEYFTISTGSSTADFGDLTSARSQPAGCSNAENQRAVIIAGTTGTNVNIMDYITINSPSDALDFGDYTYQTNAFAGTSNGINDRGIASGGGNATGRQAIEYLTISTTGGSSSFGDMTTPTYLFGATSNGRSERAIFAGGFTGSVATNIIDYITMTSLGDATDFGDLTSTRYDVSATSNTTNDRGLIIGGDGADNIIEYVTITTPSGSTDFGDLTEANAATCSTSNGVHEKAIVMAGNDTDRHLDTFTISTTSDATIWGLQLTQKTNRAAESNSS